MAQDGMLPAGVRQAASEEIARALGRDRCAGHRVGAVSWPRLRAPGDDRHPALRRQPVRWSSWRWSVLRFREPNLARPFRVPGGLFGAVAIGIPPMLLLGFSIFRSQHETSLRHEFVRLWHDSDRCGRRSLLHQSCPEAGGVVPPRRKTSTRSIIASNKKRTGERVPVLCV